MENKTVSVIIPIFNAEPYLEQCLDSLLAQDYSALEILCINDGSNDNSLATMQNYAKLDQRIRVIDKKNEGYGASCNRGIEEASGHWISIIEPDDWIEQGMYSSMLNYAQNFDVEPDIIKTPYWRIINPDTPEQVKINCTYRSRIPEGVLLSIGEATQLLEHHPSIWSALYRRDYLMEKNIRFKPIPGAGWADNPWLIATLCQTDRIVFLNKPFYCYREETIEKTRNFALKNTYVPLERWNDMQDILDRLNVKDPRILRSHIRRGFIYLSGIYSFVDINDPELRERATQMCERMDPDLVLSDNEIPPFDRRLFAELMGLPEPKISQFSFNASLLGKGLYFVANTGLRYSAKMTLLTLRRELHKNWQTQQYGEELYEEETEAKQQ